MDFALSEEQSLLRTTLSQFLAQRYDFNGRVAASRGDLGYRQDVWDALANDLGLMGVAVPSEHGGLGGGAVEQMIVMEELGRALALEPVAETLFQGGFLLQRGETPMANALLSDAVAGKVRLAVALGEPGMRYDLSDIATSGARSSGGWRLDGTKAVVIAAPWATHLVVAARSAGKPGDQSGLSLFVVPANADGLTLHAYPTIDGRRAADLALDGVRVDSDGLLGAEGQALPLIEEMRDRAIAAQAAEASGLLSKLLEDTIEYTKQRKQFGQPISGFQVLQHRMVDMFMHVEMTRSAAVLASLKLDGDPVERARAASTAKVTVANACRFVGQNAVQLHGGMGMTDELSIGHYFKRATLIESEHGTADWHLARHAALAAN